MEELCSACLCSGRKLTCISGSSVYYFYKQIVNELSSPEEMHRLVKVCWECNALLRRFQSFQQQVKCCYIELLMCLQQNPSLKASLQKPSHLQTHSAVNISFPEVKPESLEIKIETDEVHCEPETFANQLMWRNETRQGKLEPDEVLPSESDSFVNQLSRPKRSLDIGKTKKKENRKVKLKRKAKMKKEVAYESDLDTVEHFNDTLEADKTEDESRIAMEAISGTNGKDNDSERVSCEQCGSTFATQSELDTHVELEHDFALEKADGGTWRAGRSREVLPEKPQCVECGKIFSSRKTYRYHLNVLHKGQNRHPCPKCGKVYQWKSNLGRHMRSHKARESGELYCVKCDKSFASVATYRQHIRISRRHVSESEFTFTCDECGKKFVSKTRLRDHVDWEHLNKIKFRCQLCNKPFKCHTSLYVHVQNVHRNKEKKDNLCHVCGKSYQNAAKLKYHIVAMHTSETPYQCAECDAAFGWYSSLYRHVREVHYKVKIQSKKNKKEKKLHLQELIPLAAGPPGP